MAPQEEFYNLESRQRGKKEFKFYDKIVPQPFKITPSPTPTPSATLTPTPTPSQINLDCIYFDVTGNTWDGTYLFFGYGKLSIAGTTYTLENTGNYAIYYYINGGNTSLMCQNDFYPGTVVMEWVSGVPSYGQTADALQLGIKDTICYNTVGLYRYPCLGLITSETRDYTATNVVCPSPTPTPSITTTPSITPSITPSTVPLPNDSYVEIDQFFSSPTAFSYGCFSLSGTGYIEKISLTEFQFVEGTHPDGNDYSFYIKNLSADTVVLSWLTDDRNEPKVWEWATAYFPNKTSTGWTDGETFPSLNSQRALPYTDNTTVNGYHYPSRTGIDYYCGSIPPSATPGLTPTPTPSSVYQNGFKLTNTDLGMDGTYVLANTGFYDEFRGSTAGQFYTGWVCINPDTFIPPYGNIYKNINNDDKFVNVEAFNGGNVVRLYNGSLTSQVPSDPNNPFSCNTRLFDSSKEFGYNFTGSATTYCSLAFPVSGSTTFGDVEYLPCI